MDASILIRTGSGRLPTSPAVATAEHEGAGRPSFLCRSRSIGSSTIRSIVHLEIKDRKGTFSHTPTGTLRRSHSVASLIGSGSVWASSRPKQSPAKIAEDDDDKKSAVLEGGALGRTCSAGCSSGRFMSLGVTDRATAGISTGTEVLQEELEFSGGGAGKGRKIGGGGGGRGGGGDQQSGMGAHYKEMLRADPENPLLLMNYGKYLQEVEGDLERAEDCYGRAILASPSDGEALSLYGRLVWEAHKDEKRADDYFQRAVETSPNDCYVLGSYAHFLWDADDDGEEKPSAAAANPKMIEAF